MLRSAAATSIPLPLRLWRRGVAEPAQRATELARRRSRGLQGQIEADLGAWGHQDQPWRWPGGGWRRLRPACGRRASVLHIHVPYTVLTQPAMYGFVSFYVLGVTLSRDSEPRNLLVTTRSVLRKHIVTLIHNTHRVQLQLQSSEDSLCVCVYMHMLYMCTCHVDVDVMSCHVPASAPLRSVSCNPLSRCRSIYCTRQPSSPSRSPLMERSVNHLSISPFHALHERRMRPRAATRGRTLA